MKKAALILRLVERLREQGSWCGETHVQEAIFFLQELMYVPMEFDFILYKHGLFSFDLRDELTALRADELLDLEPQRPYDPRITLTNLSEHLQKRYPKTLKKYDNRIKFVGEKLGSKEVAELERLATALYVTKCLGFKCSAQERDEELTRLNPHISVKSAKSAIEEVDGIVQEAYGLIE